jgi:hypothetical protein
MRVRSLWYVVHNTVSTVNQVISLSLRICKYKQRGNGAGKEGNSKSNTNGFLDNNQNLKNLKNYYAKYLYQNSKLPLKMFLFNFPHSNIQYLPKKNPQKCH